MATMAIATNGRTALLSSYVELGRRLRRHGHRVVVVADAEVTAGLTDRGEEAVGVNHDHRFAALADADPPPAGFRPAALVRWLAGRRDLRARSLRDGPDEVAAAVASVDPDLVILDAESSSACWPPPASIPLTFLVRRERDLRLIARHGG